MSKSIDDCRAKCEHEQINSQEIQRIFARWVDELGPESARCGLFQAISYLIDLELCHAVSHNEIPATRTAIVEHIFSFSTGVISVRYPDTRFVISNDETALRTIEGMATPVRH